MAEIARSAYDPACGGRIEPLDLARHFGEFTAMLQCEECEFFHRGADGSPKLACNPFSTIKEPECLTKWQVYQLSVIAKSHQATLDMYQRLAPLQEKMFRHMEREIEETEDADAWKFRDDEDEEDDDDLFRV